MNKKVIATILALGMVAGAFAMMATPVKAADPMSYHFYDTTSWGDVRLRDTTSDGTDINGGVARWIVVDTPAQFPTDVTTEPGNPMPGMATWIGSAGRSGTDYYCYVQTSAGQTNPTAGEAIVFFLEKDPNIAAAPQVYNPTSAAAPAGGTVPHGYIWAGADTFSWTSDNEPLMSGSPPTTFFEVLEMPAPVGVANVWNWAGVTGPADVAGGPAGTNSQIVTWQLYESVGDNNGPWTQVGSANFGSSINYVTVGTNYYSVGVTFTAGVKSTVLSQPVIGGGAPPVNEISAVTNAASTPNPHNGNTVNEFVTITADITDLDAADVLSAEYRVDGGAWVAFAQTGVSPLAVSGVFNFPAPYTEAIHTVEIRGYDGTAYSPIVNANFDIDDTTAPLAAWDTVPGATAFWTNDIVISATYEDFGDIQGAGSYLTWALNGVPQANIPFVNTFDGFGSYLYTCTATIPAGSGAAGDVITYGGQVTAASTVPQTTVLGAGAPITLQDPPVLTDPFPVFGAVVLYDGTEAGGYSPNPAPAGVAVTVGWYDFGIGAWNTIATVTDASGFYTVDIANVVVGDPTGIEVAAGPFTGPGNMGYAWVPVVAAYAVGGVQVDVTCGVPAEVIITAPLDLSNVIAGTPFLATYTIVDIDGVLATGYYTFEGQMLWTSSDPAFVAPAGRSFDGVASATPGTATDSLTLWTPPQQTIRIGENGLASNNMPSSLGDYGPINIGGVSTPVFTDDWDEITLNIMGDSFDWNMVIGWNIVSVPMDPVFKGLDGTFDGADALAECNVQFPDPELALATRSDLGVYTVIDLSVTEAAAFDMDGVHGYWVYSEVGGIVNFLALDYDIVANPTVNQVAAVAGWNLLGFTHNFATLGHTWNGALDANYLTTTLLSVPMTAKVVATEWDYTNQVYYSYVVTPTFVMPSRNWAWDFSYSAMPANGFYLWLDAAQTLTFNMDL